MPRKAEIRVQPLPKADVVEKKTRWGTMTIMGHVHMGNNKVAYGPGCAYGETPDEALKLRRTSGAASVRRYMATLKPEKKAQKIKNGIKAAQKRRKVRKEKDAVEGAAAGAALAAAIEGDEELAALLRDLPQAG